MQKRPSDRSPYASGNSGARNPAVPALFEFAPIGVIRTAFAEKFGIPRQPGMVREAKGVIELNPHPFLTQACRSLETFSHLWLIFVFHEHGARDWKPSIRPPRLGGRKKVGVLSSRSPHRPNPIGLSAVKLDRIEFDAKPGTRIHVSGVDLLDGTPILDLKPYLPFADAIPDAVPGWAAAPIAKYPVAFTAEAETALAARQARLDAETPGGTRLREMITEMLELDPRPASQKRKMPAEASASEGLRFAFTVGDVDVKWEIRGETFHVTAIEPIVAGRPRTRSKDRASTTGSSGE